MNWDYIAGFFDGEGTVGKYSLSGYKIGISQANKKVLEQIQLFTGIGYIHSIKKRQPHWKNAWLYYVAKQEDIYFFLNKTANRLIVKKAEVLRILPDLKRIKRDKDRQRIRLIKRKRLAKNLRGKCLSYREIGKQLGIDWGYARRIILDLK